MQINRFVKFIYSPIKERRNYILRMLARSTHTIGRYIIYIKRVGGLHIYVYERTWVWCGF